MKYRFFTVAITLSMIVWFPLQGAASHQFPDVSTSSKYHDAVEYLENLEVIQGYQDGTFKPTQSINRVETLKILFKGTGAVDSAFGTPSETETAGFSDTIAGQWYIKYVLFAKNMGVIAGYPDGTFRPTNQVNLAEALKMLFLVFDESVPPVENPNDLPNDVKPSDWFAKYIAYALEKNIISKNALGNVQPGKGQSRGAVTEMTYRLRYMQDNNLGIFVIPSGSGEEGFNPETDTVTFIETPIKGTVSRVDQNTQSFLFGVANVGFFTVNVSQSTAYSGDKSETPSFSMISAGDIGELTGTLDVRAKTFEATSVQVSSFGLHDPNFVYMVAIEDNVFSPPTLSAFANVEFGDSVKVRFTNLSNTPHQVASDPHPTHTNLPEFVSSILNKGDLYEFIFADEGTFTYHCHLHPNMRGTIAIVQPRG